jgi:hypothetical protein
MKTLGKEITKTFFNDPEGFEKLNYLASAIGQNRMPLTPAQFLVMNAARGHDWTKSFAVPSNSKQIENGSLNNWPLVKALNFIHDMAELPNQTAVIELFLNPFCGVLTRRGLTELAKHLPRVDQFACTVPKKDKRNPVWTVVAINRLEIEPFVKIGEGVFEPETV